MRIPVQAETFGLVSNKLNLSVDLSKGSGLERVLRSVEDKDLAIHTKSGDNVRILRLVSSLVDFSGVLNLLNDLALDSSDITRLTVATNLASLVIIVLGIGRYSLWNLNIGNLKKVGALI
jgi:hypothetical protein